MRNSTKKMVLPVLVVLLAAAVVTYMFVWKSKYEGVGEEVRGSPLDNSGLAPTNPLPDLSATGVNANLAPKIQPVPIEDTAALVPTDVLKGQSFLDTRSLIGYPESISGSLRNSNQQIRSEPENPRKPISIFNNSTIVADTMRRPFEIGGSH